MEEDLGVNLNGQECWSRDGQGIYRDFWNLWKNDIWMCLKLSISYSPWDAKIHNGEKEEERLWKWFVEILSLNARIELGRFVKTHLKETSMVLAYHALLLWEGNMSCKQRNIAWLIPIRHKISVTQESPYCNGLQAFFVSLRPTRL